MYPRTPFCTVRHGKWNNKTTWLGRSPAVLFFTLLGWFTVPHRLLMSSFETALFPISPWISYRCEHLALIEQPNLLCLSALLRLSPAVTGAQGTRIYLQGGSVSIKWFSVFFLTCETPVELLGFDGKCCSSCLFEPHTLRAKQLITENDSSASARLISVSWSVFTRAGDWREIPPHPLFWASSVSCWSNSADDT